MQYMNEEEEDIGQGLLIVTEHIPSEGGLSEATRIKLTINAAKKLMKNLEAPHTTVPEVEDFTHARRYSQANPKSKNSKKSKSRCFCCGGVSTPRADSKLPQTVPTYSKASRSPTSQLTASPSEGMKRTISFNVQKTATSSAGGSMMGGPILADLDKKSSGDKK
mmetsp:Transcript_19762/g.29545  ORF Transcript_19762/g.29545 Transcript_19762/m.29545 type:complete len:164 (-) Transcript_19762:22-513(-)